MEQEARGPPAPVGQEEEEEEAAVAAVATATVQQEAEEEGEEEEGEEEEDEEATVAAVPAAAAVQQEAEREEEPDPEPEPELEPEQKKKQPKPEPEPEPVGEGEGEGKEEENNTKSIEYIVNETIKNLNCYKEFEDFQYKDKIKQSIIDVIQYKLDGAKENDLKAKKNILEDTGYIEHGQILIDAPSDETSHKPKSWAMRKNIGNTMASAARGLRRMYRSKDKSANLNDVILNSIKRAKTGECFTLGKHFRTTGTSNLDSHDAKIFTEFCIYATYNLYEELTKELKTSIASNDNKEDGGRDNGGDNHVDQGGKNGGEGEGEDGGDDDGGEDGIRDGGGGYAEGSKKERKTIDYEIEKFCNKYFQYFFEFARINIYVIVNCSSILNDLAKALALLIGLQLKKSIGTAKQPDLSVDKSNQANKSLTQQMKEQNLFGSGAFFNMYSLNIIKYIGFIYENSIPEIERLIGSVNDKYTRLKILDNYLTSKYEKMVLGKEIHQKDNEKYEIDNPFIKNLLQDIFPYMGFSDGSIRKKIQEIDRAIEEHSDNIDLLQTKLNNLLDIKFEDNGLLFANEKIQKIMIQDGDKDELKRIIKEKEDEKDKLTRLLAQAPASARKDSAP